MLKTDLHLLSNRAGMDTYTHQKRPLMRSCSFGDTTTQSSTFQTLSQTTNLCKERKGLSRERRKTVASCIPPSMDQNGNSTEKDVNRQVYKSLSELNTEEVCKWFTSIGLQKCLPFIREAQLCGADLASVDSTTLDILHIITLEDREQLLSAIYNELHPPSTMTRTLDSMLGPDNVETFTATLASMTKSKSSPHVSCLSMRQRSLKLSRNPSHNLTASRTSQMIEITINASEQIVHLRTPKETTVGKIMGSCVKMLGMTDDKSSLILKEHQDSPEQLSPDRQIGSILTSKSENGQLELYLCKTDKSTSPDLHHTPEINSPKETDRSNENVLDNHPAKEERIRELNQQVDSLQNVVLQVQELHHGLVAFCSELKTMDTDVNVDGLGSAELRERLEVVNSQLMEKRQNFLILRDNVNNSTAHGNKWVHRFKKHITVIEVMTPKYSPIFGFQEKAQEKALSVGNLSQLVSPQSPAMLMVIQENQGPDGHYGFTCGCREEGGLVVVEVDNSHLCVDDRLVEVNGVSVVSSTLEELTDLLSGPNAQMVVIRRLPPTLASHLLQQPMVRPEPAETLCPKRDAVTMETHPQRKLIAI
ncbi:putative LOC107375453-like protein [Nothobranchius furzeri]|uniref:LOC107375453-like protein n=1 Tax=Nothobranchius furzeri TaxID=105023 RepID=A0A9D2YFP4_NOTFU|nr:putative LOC107375453-like protein [Nothobranchius furzeri]